MFLQLEHHDRAQRSDTGSRSAALPCLVPRVRSDSGHHGVSASPSSNRLSVLQYAEQVCLLALAELYEYCCLACQALAMVSSLCV